jgi:hypothetical protein
MDAASRRLVRQRARFRCEYCQIHEGDEPYSFHIEHIIAKKHAGAGDPSNLAWSCQSCNLGANLSGYIDGRVVTLFDPRRQKWTRHFAWDGPVLVGKTKCGRATIAVLSINQEDRVELRTLLIATGEFPK